jgi:MFS family permease
VNAITSLVFGAWTAIMVLFGQDRLGLGNVGYGLLGTGVAAGSLVGSLVASRRSRLLGQRRLLLVSAATFGVVLLVMALAAIPIISTQAIEAARAAVQPSNSPSWHSPGHGPAT